MAGHRIELDVRAPFNAIGGGYRYLLLTIITVAIVFASTVVVLASVSQTRVAPAAAATPMPADMPGMIMTPTGVPQPAIDGPLTGPGH